MRAILRSFCSVFPAAASVKRSRAALLSSTRGRSTGLAILGGGGTTDEAPQNSSLEHTNSIVKTPITNLLGHLGNSRFLGGDLSGEMVLLLGERDADRLSEPSEPGPEYRSSPDEASRSELRERSGVSRRCECPDEELSLLLSRDNPLSRLRPRVGLILNRVNRQRKTRGKRYEKETPVAGG